MLVYRGFSCVEEVIKVLKSQTVGGEYYCPEDAYINRYDIINKQKSTGGECYPQIKLKSDKNRKGIIEYTTDENVAMRFGPLCVIGGEVDSNFEIAYNGYSQDPEKGVFFYVNIPIDIQCFYFGFNYNNYENLKNIINKSYLPRTCFKPIENNKDQKILVSFIIDCIPIFANLVNKPEIFQNWRID